MTYTLTDSQRYTLDRVVHAGWKPVHQNMDGSLVIQRRVHHSGSSGVGVSLPGPFWTRVGASSGRSETQTAEIMLDGTVPVIEKMVAADKNKIMVIGMVLGPLMVITPVFPIALITVPFGAWLTWYAWRRFLRSMSGTSSRMSAWAAQMDAQNVASLRARAESLDPITDAQKIAQLEKKASRIERTAR